MTVLTSPSQLPNTQYPPLDPRNGTLRRRQGWIEKSCKLAVVNG